MKKSRCRQAGWWDSLRVVYAQRSQVGQRDARRWRTYQDRWLWNVQRRHLRRPNNKDVLWYTRLHRSRGLSVCLPSHLLARLLPYESITEASLA